jgi:DNA end-binding protein Ku
MPDGLAAQHAYSVLTLALQQRQKWALGRVVLGGQRVLALVRPKDAVLTLHVLHFPEQLRGADGAPVSSTEAVSAEEQHLAGLLIDAASQPITWTDYRDDNAEQLRALIQTKLQGRTLAAPVPEEIPILQLVDALKRSVAQALHEPVVHGPGHPDAGKQAAEAAPSQPQPKKKPARKPSSRRSA